MSIPPLIAWYQRLLETETVLAVLLGLVLAAIGVVLFRMALKVFLVFLILLLAAIGLSYLFMGEAATEQELRRGARELQDAIEGEPPPAGAGAEEKPPPPPQRKP